MNENVNVTIHGRTNGHFVQDVINVLLFKRSWRIPIDINYKQDSDAYDERTYQWYNREHRMNMTINVI